jgi:hypothetical protein
MGLSAICAWCMLRVMHDSQPEFQGNVYAMP